MKAAVAAIALSVAATAAPLDAAHAHTAVAVDIATPTFAIRLGAPPAPMPVAYPPPVYVAPPLYAPPVYYAPPRLVVAPPAVYPVVLPYRPPLVGYRRHGHRELRGFIVPRGYAYGRH